MSASASLSDVLKMLDQCAPGYTIRLANHSRVIHFGGKVFPSLPKHDPLEIGHIRKMARWFGIEACGAKYMPGVIKAPPTVPPPPTPPPATASPKTSFKKKK